MERKFYVTASELGDYVYCKRGWWLRNHGLLPETAAMRAGIAAHNALSRKLSQHRLVIALVFLLFILGIIGIVFYLFSLLFT